MGVSQAKAPRQASKRPFRMIKGVSVLADLADGAGAYGYPGDYPGRIYFVNNISGNSAYDGLSWETPFAQVSEAITASETFRALPSGTTNDYQRNIIFVQGTGTAYTKLTVLPHYCDLIGIGADPRGNGAGIARIGSDTVAESAVVSSVTVRGLNVYNIQFQAGINKYPFQCTAMFRCRFENCTFMTNGAATGNPTAAFYSSAALGGVVFKDCHFGSNCSVDTEPDIGFKIEGTHFHNCLVEDCFISGLQGVTIASTVIAAQGSMFKNNFIGDASQAMTICVNDDTNAVGGFHTVYAGNYVRASGIAFDLETDGGPRCIGNYEINDFVAANA